MKKIIISLAVGLLAFAAFDVCAQLSSVPELTSASYASMKKDEVYVVVFTGPGCGPCIKAKKELLPLLARQYASEENVHVYVFPTNTDVPAPDGTHLYTQLGVRGVPTFVVLYNGTSVFSHTGYSADMAPRLKKDIASAVSRVK